MTDASAAPAAPPGSRLPLLLMVAGLLMLGYGLVLLSPPGPSAMWNGVLDSASVTPSRTTGVLGQSISTRAVTLYLQRISANRVLKLPAGFAALADSFRPGDTLHLVLGYGRNPDTAFALGITRNSAVILDSAVVLGDARRQSNRVALAGGIMALAGAFGLLRRRMAAGPPPPPAPIVPRIASTPRAPSAPAAPPAAPPPPAPPEPPAS